MDINCIFSEPLEADGVPPNLNSQEWEFSKMDCSVSDFPTSSTSTLPEYISQVISTSSPANNFYISKTIDLGQILILGLFVLAFVFAITVSIKNLIFSQKIKF
jgi:hypothetical protein